jgi:hypothetical protein
MSLSHRLNLFIDKIEKKKYKPGYRKPLLEGMDQVFEMHGEGLYISCLKSEMNNIVSKAIAAISGPYSHSIMMLHANNIKKLVTDEEWARLKDKYKSYYITSPTDDIDWLLSTINILVLGSADANGMNYFDFSQYQLRRQVIFKVPCTQEQQQAILRDILSEKSMSTIYDFTGLAFWWMKRAFDDERAWYCSEQVANVFYRNGRPVSRSLNPSPTQLVQDNLLLSQLVYSNVNL